MAMFYFPVLRKIAEGFEDGVIDESLLPPVSISGGTLLERRFSPKKKECLDKSSRNPR